MDSLRGNEKDDDDEDFTFTRVPVNPKPKRTAETSKQRRQPVEHDEEARSPAFHDDDSRSSLSNRPTTSRNISVTPAEAEKYHQDIVAPLSPDIRCLREVNQLILRQLSECMGQVVYGTPEKVCIAANYWGEVAASKNKRAKKNCVYTMETESEGVLLTKALSLDARLIYHFPLCYTRITPTTFVPSHASSESIKAVGVGQFGKVFKAIDCKTKQAFAEKIVAIERFAENEVKIHCQLDHPNVVKFYGAIRSKGGIHIFMQYAGGGSIQQLLRDNRGFVGSGSIDRHLFSEYWGVYYYKQILSALYYLHSLNIIHCDLKPSNVVLSCDNRNCYLTDFGEARIVRNNTGFVKLDKLVGTPNYIGPETIEKDEYHYASDIWSVACFLLHMLTGKVPWTIKHPGLGTYLLAITTRPFGVLDEIPSWTSNLTKSILRSSFQEINGRKSLTELLQLATKNLTILNNTRAREARSSNPENYEEERSVSSEVSLSVQEFSVSSSIAESNSANNAIIPSVAATNLAVIETSNDFRSDFYEISSSVSPPSLSFPEPHDSGDRARLSALLNSAGSDSPTSTYEGQSSKSFHVSKQPTGNSFAQQPRKSGMVCNGTSVDVSDLDGELSELNFNVMINNEDTWQESTDPSVLEELSEILRQSSVEPETTVNDSEAASQLNEILHEYDRELQTIQTTPSNNNSTAKRVEKPCTSSQCLLNGLADENSFGISPTIYNEDIDLSSIDFLSLISYEQKPGDVEDQLKASKHPAPK